MIIYLYVKTHNITGLKYLGKTTRDPFSYNGSGLYWKRHLKKYGCSVHTEVLYQTENKEDFKNKAIEYSKHFYIVDSPSWANLREETGHGGFSKEDARKGGLSRSKEDARKGGLTTKARGYCFGGKNGPSFSECTRRSAAARKGIKLTESHKEALSLSHSNRVAQIRIDNPEYIHPSKGKIRTKYECIHCGKIGAMNTMSRFHFDNCRSKNLKQ